MFSKISTWIWCSARLYFNCFVRGSSFSYIFCALIYLSPTRLPYHMMFVSFNSHMTCGTGGTETASPSEVPELTPVFSSFWCCFYMEGRLYSSLRFQCQWNKPKQWKHCAVMFCSLSSISVSSTFSFIWIILLSTWILHGRDRMVVGFTTTYAISAYHHCRILIRARCTTLCDNVCQWLATGRWFSLGSPVSSINKTDCHNIAEILLKVAFITIKQTNKCYSFG